MNDMLDIEGKTIDEAIRKACEAFSVPREKLDIEILSEGSSGFFGILGVKPALIRARILSIDINIDTGKDVRTPEKKMWQPADNDLAPRAKEFVAGMISLIGFDFPVAVEQDEDEYMVINIKGDGGGLLIGRGGQTLDAIQYLTNKALNKNGNGGKRIILDTENYRKKKEEHLTSLAEKLGEKAKKTKKPVTVNPLNAHDRRIIHMALQNDKELTTRSRGEGPFRKIIIVPKKGGKTKS